MYTRIIESEYIKGDVSANGNLVFTNDVSITGNLCANGIKVKGHLNVGGSITAQESITVDGHIKAGDQIKAGGDIEAGSHIKVDNEIDAGGNIKAGSHIKATLGITSDGDITTGTYLESDCNIRAKSICAGSHIQANTFIRTNGSIKSGDCIEAGWTIEARGGNIEAADYIIARWHIETDGYIKARWYIVPGEYCRASRIETKTYVNTGFEILDLENINCRAIRFCSTTGAERRFWSEALAEVPDIDPLIEAIGSSCWSYLLDMAREHKEQLLSYDHYMPVVRQAIEHMLKEKN